MKDTQIERYSRQILLPEIDLAGQEKLLNSKVLIIGLGGLGSPAALYLAASGLGTLTLCDHDVVELSNLHRQIIHRNSDIGRHKSDSAANSIHALNPDIQVNSIPSLLEGNELAEQVSQADIVIDATDNFSTRQLINATCLACKTPLISGSAIRMSGQITSFRFDISPTPCYHCLYPYHGNAQESCQEAGVLPPLTGVIGSLQAIEAIKIILNIGDSLHGRLLQLDAKTMTSRTSLLKSDPACPVCSKHTTSTEPLEYQAGCR